MSALKLVNGALGGEARLKKMDGKDRFLLTRWREDEKLVKLIIAGFGSS